MKRREFEHVLRAAAAIVDDELVVIGSQAVLGQYPDAPESLLQSLEVDLFPRNDPHRASEIDRAIGVGSRFHETYDYYAHGVRPETPIAPAGWEGRLILVEVAGTDSRETVRAWCMEANDLVLAKLAAGRPHDLEFVEEAIRVDLVDVEQLLLRVELMPERHREPTRRRLTTVISKARRRSVESPP